MFNADQVAHCQTIDQTNHQTNLQVARQACTYPAQAVVVVNTRAGSRYGHIDCVSSGCGVGYEATMYPVGRGMRLTSTDAWSRDAPFAHTAVK